MTRTSAIALAGAVLLLGSLAASANQPAEVMLSDLAVGGALTVLLMDPYAATEWTLELPQGYATLDVDADPFLPAT
ncbi:MAG: hypothetical protein IPK28_11420 [Devosia sp.]|nr:hypothetical protein [Devosia sp.]